MQKRRAKRPFILRSLLPFLFLSCSTLPASAQLIDYGSLEGLFGESVTTSATGKPQRASEAPVTMDIITAEEIRRSGATTIPDILKNHAGMSVWQWTRTDQDVSIRGYNQPFSPRLLVLVNGRQVYINVYNYTAWNTIPVQLEEIRQIEIVKGPNTALFGFNAVGGVINIITYNPQYDDVSNIGARYGTDNDRQIHGMGTQKLGDKLSLRLSGDIERAHEFNADPASDFFVNPEQHALNLDSVLKITDKSEARVELSHSFARRGEISPGYNAFNSKYQTDSAKADYVQEINNNIVQATVYRTWLTSASDLAGLANTSTVAQLSDLFQVGSHHNFRVQAEYQNNYIQSDELFGADATLGYDVYALSGMWNWALRNDMTWTNALRGDYLSLYRDGLPRTTVFTSNEDFDQSITAYSYNSGLVWQATPDDTIRLMTARGVQSPSLIDFGMNLAFPPLTFSGNPNIDPTIVTNYEIGYDRKIHPINATLQSSIFYQKTKSIKNTTADFTFPVGMAGNIGDSDATGLELGLKGKIGPHWSWGANYTFEVISDDLTVNQSGAPLQVDYDGEDDTPRHMLNANVGYAIGRWETDVFANYVSDYQVLSSAAPSTYTPVDISDYIAVGGRIGYKLNDHLTFAVSGQNLTRKATPQTSGPDVERQVFVSVSSSF